MAQNLQLALWDNIDHQHLRGAEQLHVLLQHMKLEGLFKPNLDQQHKIRPRVASRCCGYTSSAITASSDRGAPSNDTADVRRPERCAISLKEWLVGTSTDKIASPPCSPAHGRTCQLWYGNSRVRDCMTASGAILVD